MVVPEKKILEKWAEENGISTENYEDLLKDDKVKKHILENLKKIGKESGFFGFEIPQQVHLTSTVFTVENDLLTPTFKIKRDKVRSYFISQIKDMYGGAKLQGEDK